MEESVKEKDLTDNDKPREVEGDSQGHIRDHGLHKLEGDSQGEITIVQWVTRWDFH